MFDKDTLVTIGADITQDGDFYMFESNRYRAGFLYKTMVMSGVITEGVKPSLSELEKYTASVDDADLECKYYFCRLFTVHIIFPLTFFVIFSHHSHICIHTFL